MRIEAAAAAAAVLFGSYHLIEIAQISPNCHSVYQSNCQSDCMRSVRVSGAAALATVQCGQRYGPTLLFPADCNPDQLSNLVSSPASDINPCSADGHSER